MLCAEERDFKTAFSYFYEAFETYQIQENYEVHATGCLKNMLLCKVCVNLFFVLSRGPKHPSVLL